MWGGAWCLGELCVPEDGSVCPAGWGVLCLGDSVSWGSCVSVGTSGPWGVCVPVGGSLSEGMEGRGWEGLYIHIQSTLEQRRD